MAMEAAAYRLAPTPIAAIFLPPTHTPVRPAAGIKTALRTCCKQAHGFEVPPKPPPLPLPPPNMETLPQNLTHEIHLLLWNLLDDTLNH